MKQEAVKIGVEYMTEIDERYTGQVLKILYAYKTKSEKERSHDKTMQE